MEVLAVFKKADEVLGSFTIQVDGPGDLLSGGREAFNAFRAKFPDISLFDKDLVVSFEKPSETK